jgi:uncharacterized protein YjbI with pentapeptide repeats
MRLNELDRTGLDWTGLDWTGLDWTGLDWTGLDWTGLDRTGLNLNQPQSSPFGILSVRVHSPRPWNSPNSPGLQVCLWTVQDLSVPLL